MMRWLDTHAHLQDEEFETDLNEVLWRANDAGVERIILATSTLRDSQRALKIAAKNRNLACMVGIHPHEARTCTESVLTQLRQLISETLTSSEGVGADCPLVAIGEIGLDYHYDFAPRAIQQEVMWQQIELAHEFQLPLVLHIREAFGDAIALLQRAQKASLLLEKAGVVHCYSGSVESAQILLELGFDLGFDGPLTFKNAKQPEEVVRFAPLERLHLETDSPYLAPVPYRGKRNEPCFVPQVAQRMAAFKGISMAELSEQLGKNAVKLFGDRLS